MEVPGQKHDKKLCYFCEVSDKTTLADGSCVECNVSICQKCFVRHKVNNNRDHTRGNILESPYVKTTHKDSFDLCHQHSEEFIKHYCPTHDQVCCAECIVLHHQGCKLELVRVKAVAFQNSNNLNDLSKEIKKCIKKAQDSASLVKCNTQLLTDVYAQFVREVNTYVDEIIERINTMKTVILDKGEKIMSTDKERMNNLTREIDELKADVSQQNYQLESKRNQPKQLFLASISIKKELKTFKQHLDLLQKENTISQYTFQRDEMFENILKEKEIGGLLERPEIGKQKHGDVKQTVIAKESNKHARQVQHTSLDDRSELDMYTVRRDDNVDDYVDNRYKQTLKTNKQTTETRHTKENTVSVSQQRCESLVQRKLYCKNINIDRQILSYAAIEESGAGLYVCKEELYAGNNFAIEIVALGRKGSIAVGVVSRSYEENLPLGSGQNSCGYHSDGNNLYTNSCLDISQTVQRKLDKCGRGIEDNATEVQMEGIFYSQNLDEYFWYENCCGYNEAQECTLTYLDLFVRKTRYPAADLKHHHGMEFSDTKIKFSWTGPECGYDGKIVENLGSHTVVSLVWQPVI